MPTQRFVLTLALTASAVLLATGCATTESFQQIHPGIRWDRNLARIAVDGSVCLEDGILEYVAVIPGGKEYESFLRLNCRPMHLQQVMLMAGYEIGEPDEAARGDYAGESKRDADAPPAATPPKGYWSKSVGTPNQVAIEIEVQDEAGVWNRKPIETFLIDRETGQPPKQLRWVFTGSYFVEGSADQPGFFAADRAQSVIALWYDPTCLLNLSGDVGNPYRGDDAGLEVGRAGRLQRDTPVRLILRPGR